LALGGGHDYAYADGSAFLKVHRPNGRRRPRPLVINIDAHLDVRPPTSGLNSGTPFHRLLTAFDDFEFVEIGAQPQACSTRHLEWAEERGVRVYFWETLNGQRLGPLAELRRALRALLSPRRPTFLSIDIDAFSSAYAPGCSQSFPTGFAPGDLLPILDFFADRLAIAAVGIYEVAPPLDHDQRTARLAALLAHRIVYRTPRR
jgi:formiminoglutamase